MSALSTALGNLLTGVFDRAKLEEALKQIDVDGDGLVHVDEIRWITEKYGEQMQDW